MIRWIPWALFAVLASPVGAIDFPDDVSDRPETALLLAVNQSVIQKAIEPDTDQDWFAFLAQPYVTYTVTVQSVSAWDMGVTVSALLDGLPVMTTNSAFTPPTARFTWSHTGPPLTVQIGMRSLFSFTTGSYSLAVRATETDLDGDHLPDAWEMARFGTITNTPGGDPDGDGMTTWNEYGSGTHPAQSSSVLRVSAIGPEAGQVSWNAAPYARYRIQQSTSILHAAWTDTGRSTNTTSGAATLQFIDPGAAAITSLYYRLVVPDPLEP